MLHGKRKIVTRAAIAGGLLLGVVCSTLAITVGVATAGPGCGTEPDNNDVYISCAIPPAVPPYTLYSDGESIDLSMGPNSAFSGTGSGADIVAIECEYTNGSGQPGDPPQASGYCDASTAPGDFPYSVAANGSFDYEANNPGDVANIWALPDSTFPGANIVCNDTSPCVWYVGSNYENFSAPHFFSNPFLVATPPTFTSAASDTVLVGQSFTFPVTATGNNPVPNDISLAAGSGTPTGVTLGSTTVSGDTATADLDGTSSVAVGTYHFTLQASGSVGPATTQPFTLNVAAILINPPTPAPPYRCAPGGNCGTVTWTASGLKGKEKWVATVPGSNSKAVFPKGVKFKSTSSGGVLTIKPSHKDAAGSTNFTVTVTDKVKSGGHTTTYTATSSTYTLTIT